ncbi:hypothetical protein KC19_4G091500 [Ceratodon purpureus]|uniref:Cilia- and flagella-associated protein 43 n=1 Tax=Ceratodon purpureus TaxID=3225 RepID=A0A8T0I8H5_CERPU|nr:hypothetical protein KC19_4G091500 [Ceratodon purpureus]
MKTAKKKWRLSVAVKPHKLGVTTLACSIDGQVLASASSDGSIFFFHCPNSFRPLGFIMIPGAITCMDWSPNSQILLVGCSNGLIMEISRPDTNNDTTKSFELKDLTTTVFSFKRPPIPKKIPPKPPTPPPPPPPPPKAEGEGAEGEAPTEGEAPAEGAAPAGEAEVPMSLEEMLADGPLVPPPRIPTPPPEPIELEDAPGTSYPIRALFYSDGNLNSFYVATEGLAAGFLFECHSGAVEAMGFTRWSQQPIKTIGMTHSRKYFVSGSDNGVVRIQQAPAPGQLMGNDDESRYWEAGLHDAFYGVVTGAALSFDDQYLASVSADGSFFVHTIDFIGEKPAAPKAEPPKAPEGDVEDVPEYMLSIEEWRQKVEQDEINRLAGEAKNKLLSQLEEIRTKVASLIEENKSKERNQQLAPEDFVIDPRLRSMLEAETEAEVDQARKELQWDSEKRNVALRKLRWFFLDPIEVEYIVIHAFASGSQTSTFRVTKLSEEFKAVIEVARRQGYMGRKVSVFQAKRKQTMKVEGPKKKKEFEPADEPGITKLEFRRRMLKQRVREWFAFLQTKPDLTWVSEEDAAALEWAYTHKGDFKLKTNPGYVVPDDQYTNEILKRNEIILFQEAVHGVKMNFNDQFFALRARKTETRLTLLKKQARVAEINTILGIKDPVIPVPELRRDEMPEVREIVTQEHRDAYEAKIAAAIAAALAAESKAKEGGGLGGMGAGPKKKEEPKVEVVAPAARKVVSRSPERAKPTKRKVEPPKIVLSPLEEKEKEAKIIRLRYERTKLESEMRSIINAFDDELEKLRLEKYRLEVNMKCADLKTLVMYQVRLAEQDLVVDAAQEVLDEFIEQKNQIMLRWAKMNVPPEFNPAHAELHRMFTKKMRRPKKPKENPDDESEESDLDEAPDEDEDEYEDEDFVELCPENADPDLYKKMVKLRDELCRQHYVVVDQGKEVDVHIKEKGQIIKKRNAIQSQLKLINGEIVRFQSLKQMSLNDVEVAITLKMNQVEYMENGQLPEDLSGGLVFELREEQALIQRLHKHGEEKKGLKQLHKDLHKMHADLQRDRRNEEKKTRMTEQKYVEGQMLKFGETLTDDTLNIIMIKKDIQFLRDKLRNQEVEIQRELTVWQRKSEVCTDQLRMLTKENAAILHIIADIKEKMQNINFDMKYRAGTTYVDPLLEKQKAEAAQKILSVIITKQDEQIQELQNAIIRTKTVLPKVFPCN